MRRPGRPHVSQPPDPATWRGRPRAYLVELVRWLKATLAASDGAGMRDRFIAVTSGTITANVGVDGPLGSGSVVLRKINDDGTMTAYDTIAVKSIDTTGIPTGTLVIVERIEGYYVVTGAVC